MSSINDRNYDDYPSKSFVGVIVNNNNHPRRSVLSGLLLSLLLLLQCRVEYGRALKLENAMQLLNSVESVDPDIINFFSRRTPSSMYRSDMSEIDLSEVDTNDMIGCFATLSYTCFQKKILVFIDSLSKVDKINVFGGYISFLRVGKPYVQPPITEDMLAARGVNDAESLSALLGRVFDDFVENRIVRITVPGINARLDTVRSLSSSSSSSGAGSCFEFSLTDIPLAGTTVGTTVETARSLNVNRTITNGTAHEQYELKSDDKNKISERQNDKYQMECARGDHGMMALSSALIMKMVLLVPTLLKLVAAKTFFGIMMGLLSLILSKMALLPYFITPHKEYRRHHHLIGPSYKQQPYAPPITTSSTTTTSTTTALPTLISDSYGGYYPNVIDGPIIGGGGNPYLGPTAVMGPTGPHVYDAVWGDHNDIRDDDGSDGSLTYSSIKRHSEIGHNRPLLPGKKKQDSHHLQLQTKNHPHQESYHPRHESYYSQQDTYSTQQESYHPQQESYHPQQESYHPQQESYHTQQESNHEQQEPYYSQQQLKQYTLDGLQNRRIYPTLDNSDSNRRSSDSSDFDYSVERTSSSSISSPTVAATIGVSDVRPVSGSSWVPSKTVPGRMKRWFSWLK